MPRLLYLLLSLLIVWPPSVVAARRDRERMIGFVRVAAIVLDEKEPWSHLSKTLSLRVDPSSDSALARVIARPDEIEREGFTTSDRAVAYDRKGEWFLIRYRTGENETALAWLDPSDAGEFQSLIDLYSRHMIYLTEAWDHRVYRTPSMKSESEIVKVTEGPSQIWRVPFGGKDAIEGLEEEHDAEFVKFTNVDGELWLLVVILGPGRCSTEHNDEPVIGAGWIPMYGREGKPNAWYYVEC